MKRELGETAFTEELQRNDSRRDVQEQILDAVKREDEVLQPGRLIHGPTLRCIGQPLAIWAKGPHLRVLMHKH
jgi:hypothetical protein